MKKILSLICAAALILSFGSVCFAAETQTETGEYVFDRSMIDPDVYDGIWTTFRLDGYELFDLYLPEDFEEQELTEEEVQNGYLWYYTDKAEKHMLLIVEYTPEEISAMGVAGNEDLVRLLIENGYTETREFTTNGFQCVFSAGNKEDPSCAVWTGYGDGGALKFLMAPYSTIESMSYVMNLIFSLGAPGV